MRSIRRVLPCLWLAVALLAPAPASAEPKPPTAEENADATFAKSFIGKTYEDEFDIDGWTDLGGGLVAPPIYVHEYQREADGIRRLRRRGAPSLTLPMSLISLAGTSASSP